MSLYNYINSDKTVSTSIKHFDISEGVNKI